MSAPLSGEEVGPEADENIRWLSLAAAIASISAVGIAIGLGIPLLSVILEGRGYSASAIGLNTAFAGLASIAMAPLTVPLALRVGLIPAMIGSILVGAFAFLGFYFADAFWMWFPLRVALHAAMTVLFILSEYWITASAPPKRRGMALGIYATVLSLGFAFGPWLFAQIGSGGIAPFLTGFGITLAAAIPVIAARRESPGITPARSGGGFMRYVWIVPTATAAVLVFGAVETGGFALFPVYGARIGYSEADAALLLSMIGLGNVLLQVPIGMVSDKVADRRGILAICAAIGLVGVLLLPAVAANWYVMAGVLFVWGGVVAALYTVGLAHLGARLDGGDLASANAAFVFCYGLGMLAGPQVIGLGMDAFGPSGFAWSLALFFALYLGLVATRLRQRSAS